MWLSDEESTLATNDTKSVNSLTDVRLQTACDDSQD